jgi:thiol-disulfide isomerase/thioredoxin
MGKEATPVQPDAGAREVASTLRGARPPGFRRQLRNMFLLLVLAVVVSIVGIVISSHIRPTASLLPVGSQAPAIQPATGGPPLPDQVAAGAGHPLVVEFFETTCPVCQLATGPLCDLLQAHPGVSLLAVDAVGENLTAIAAFRADHYAACPAVSRISLISDPCPAAQAGSTPSCDNVTSRWKVAFVPTVYVVDSRGVIVAAGSGPTAVDDARAALDGLGATARPSA